MCSCLYIAILDMRYFIQWTCSHVPIIKWYRIDHVQLSLSWAKSETLWGHFSNTYIFAIALITRYFHRWISILNRSVNTVLICFIATNAITEHTPRIKNKRSYWNYWRLYEETENIMSIKNRLVFSKIQSTASSKVSKDLRYWIAQCLSQNLSSFKIKLKVP